MVGVSVFVGGPYSAFTTSTISIATANTAST
jgi:hypothetical protein